jgi:hypothetical protein
MSIAGPNSARIMALHSMCHPGRPAPQGDSQVGSPGLAAFHSAKSPGLLFRESTATRSPALPAPQQTNAAQAAGYCSIHNGLGAFSKQFQKNVFCERKMRLYIIFAPILLSLLLLNVL